MTTPKLILGAVAVLAVAGGALAFRATDRINSKIYVATTTAPTTLCTSTLLQYTIAPAGLRTQATTTATLPCVTTFITEGD